MNTLKLLKMGSTILKEKKIISFNLDSEVLLSKVLKKDREVILQNLNQKIYKKNFIKYSNLINRRSRNEPIAYILKKKNFGIFYFMSPKIL